MSPGPDPRAVRGAVAAYAFALRALPRGFRTRFGAEVREDFRREVRRAEREGGRAAVARVTIRALLDLGGRLPAEWWARSARGRDDLSREVEMWMRETKQAVRSLARRPGFTAVAVLTLALGIAANVAIFTVVNAVLLRPLPFPDSHRVVALRHHAPGLDLPELESSLGMARFYREHAPSLASLALTDGGERTLAGAPGEPPDRIPVLSATPSLFPVLRVTPALGRAFTEEDALPGAAPVAILTWEAWGSRFGQDPEVVGRRVEMDGRTTEIVGVLPRGFDYPVDPAEAWVPMYLDPDGTFGTFGLTAVARLAPGMGLEEVRTELTAIQPRVSEVFELGPDFLDRAGWSVSVDRLRDRVVGDVRTTLWVILGTVGVVLIIACANVANLFLVRAEGRQREVALRAALGASRGQLATTFLAESLALSAVAGVLGLLLALAAVRGVVAWGPPQLPRLQEIAVDGRVILFTLAISGVAGFVFGLLPVGRYLGRSFARVLRDGGRGVTDSRQRHRTRSGLVAGQLALAVVLLVGSGLMLRSFHALRSVDPGFEPRGLLTVQLNPTPPTGSPEEEGTPEARAAARATTAAFVQRVLDRVAALPGVEAVGATNSLPVLPRGANGGSFRIESRPRAEEELPPVAMNVVLTEGLLETLEVPLLRGRAPGARDHRDAAAVVWVNESFARDFLDGRALGERIAFSEESPWMEIVGVVGDVRHFGLDEEVRPMMYLPMTGPSSERSSLETMAVVVRTAGDPAAHAPAVRSIVTELDPGVPVTRTRTMAAVVGESMVTTAFTMTLLAVAALVALILGAVGIYGVIAFVVSQRTREFGVRMALGAEAGDVRSMVVRQGLAVSGLGIVVGLVAAFGATRVMASLLYGVTATDPLTFSGVAVALGAVATLASYLPARRATRVDPVEALRGE